LKNLFKSLMSPLTKDIGHLDTPLPENATASDFASLGLSSSICDAVKQQGYVTPTPIQMQSIPQVLKERDILGCAQTGTGKTAAFALPILDLLSKKPCQGKPIRALILAPTRELAIQIRESFVAYGNHLPLRSAVVFGGVGIEPQKTAIRRGCEILVATPGRLLDLASQRILDFKHLEVLVLDEADHMLDMGFIHDVKRIIKLLPTKRQNLLFSATMPPEIQQLAMSVLKDPVKVAVAPVASTTDQVKQQLYFVDRPNKRHLLLQVLKKHGVTRTLVFTRTKSIANRVAEFLCKEGIQAEAIHGNKSQSARQRALANFKQGSTPVLVASDIAARGIDVDEISHVVNYDVPNIPETYVHRIGRTGRASAVGIAISFCDWEERPFINSIERLIKERIEVVDDHPFPAKENASNTAPTPKPGGMRSSRGGGGGRSASSRRR